MPVFAEHLYFSIHTVHVHIYCNRFSSKLFIKTQSNNSKVCTFIIFVLYIWKLRHEDIKELGHAYSTYLSVYIFSFDESKISCQALFFIYKNKIKIKVLSSLR